MSPDLNSIVGLSDLIIDRVAHGESLHLWARPRERPACIHCANTSVRIKATYDRTVKHTRLGNQIMYLRLKAPNYHCPQCHRYFRQRFQSIRPRYRASDAYRLEVFEIHNGGVSQQQLKHTHVISSSTVERWYQSFIKKRVSELSGRDCPQILGIDEHFFTRKKGYATTLVDLKNHKVFDVVLGRTELALSPYFNRLQGREKVKVVVMDLSNTYRKVVRKFFPNAIIVADRFHVVRMVNHHYMDLWKQFDPVGRKNRGLISLMRRHAKQKLMQYLLLKSLNARKARELLPEFLELIEQFKNSPAATIAKTIQSWLEPIVAMWRFTKSNGITGGFHTKMEMLSRRAFGFRNFENYRLRVLAQCGWVGFFNRV